MEDQPLSQEPAAETLRLRESLFWMIPSTAASFLMVLLSLLYLIGFSYDLPKLFDNLSMSLFLGMPLSVLPTLLIAGTMLKSQDSGHLAARWVLSIYTALAEILLFCGGIRLLVNINHWTKSFGRIEYLYCGMLLSLTVAFWHIFLQGYFRISQRLPHILIILFMLSMILVLPRAMPLHRNAQYLGVKGSTLTSGRGNLSTGLNSLVPDSSELIPVFLLFALPPLFQKFRKSRSFHLALMAALTIMALVTVSTCFTCLDIRSHSYYLFSQWFQVLMKLMFPRAGQILSAALMWTMVTLLLLHNRGLVNLSGKSEWAEPVI